MLDRISVHGARQHNLKNIDVEIPRNSFTVITGLSVAGWDGSLVEQNRFTGNAANGATYSGNVPGIQMYKELTSGPYSSGAEGLLQEEPSPPHPPLSWPTTWRLLLSSGLPLLPGSVTPDDHWTPSPARTP